MKDAIFILLIVVAIGFFFFYPQEPEIKTVYKQGKSDTVTVIKTEFIEVPIKEIEYKFITDTIRDTVFQIVESTFRDTTENYELEVNAYSLLPVDSFDYKINLHIPINTITRVDTLETTKTIKETDWAMTGIFGLVCLTLGLAL
jgi:hypothetical protein